MEQLNFTFPNGDKEPFLQEYIYNVGSFHFNWHKDIELLCVLKGRVEVCSGGTVYTLEEDDVLLINSNVGHATLSQAAESIIMLLHISPSFFKKGCPDFERKMIQICSYAGNRNDRRYAELRRCMAQMMLSRISEDPSDAFAFEAALYTLAWILLKQFPSEQRKFAAYSDREDEKSVQEMIRYLETQYQDKLTLQDVATRWNYSTTYASHLFRAYVGINYYDYLTRIRLRQATRDLSETNLKILDIATKNGFQDLKSFNTKFREIFGRSPSNYRKSLEADHVRYDSTFKKEFVNRNNRQILDKLSTYAEAWCDDVPMDAVYAPQQRVVDPQDNRKELADIAVHLQRILEQLLSK